MAKKKALSAQSSPVPRYGELLSEMKTRIAAAQVRASLAINQELIQLYWDLGRRIVEQQEREGWGAAVIDQLAVDLQKAFPGVSGFSASNISRMRAFVRAYGSPENSAQAVPKLKKPNSAQAVPNLIADHPPPVVTRIPWGHNVVLLFKLKSNAERFWYANQATENGWSRSMLEHWIGSELYDRNGKAVTNFKDVLPALESDLANEVVRDPYNFDFLMLRKQAAERDLEEGLLAHIRKFLLELGAGFAFVGQQVKVTVSDEDFYVDLLFYHLKLRRYIVIDLKTTAFKPEYAGKMNFYLSAIDDQHRHADDAPSIGLILCKTRDKVIAEYALRNVGKPMGVARYTTRLREPLPAELKDALPTPKQLEDELKEDR